MDQLRAAGRNMAGVTVSADVQSPLGGAGGFGGGGLTSVNLQIAGPDLDTLNQVSDEVINQKVAAMDAARKARKFRESDAIRAELNTAGIIVEITKDGVRWRRK